MAQTDLFLGGSSKDDALRYPRSALTTHGVIVGMTGSGKSGLGVVLLEEVLRGGVPVLVIDPKGDMGNLALRFPGLQPQDFEPWVDPGEAERSGSTVEAVAEATATRWREGLDGWGLGAKDVADLDAAAEVRIWTPGSSAGAPLNVVGSLRAPDHPFDEDAETLRAEIESFVSSLLILAGIEADPISSKEHILLSHLIERAWRAGRDLEIGDLVLQVADPPLKRLGVFELDQFFPARARNKLAMRLNAVIASPSFSVWMKGPPLDIQSLLFTEDGRPRGSVIYLPHLEEAQRQFVVTLLLSKVVTWMRRQPGTSDLRALVYMDEVFGFAPPTSNPPSKRPILTLLKQARAHGLGMVLATQNPVDLDYKAMSNAGTWMVGRLSTERDKARIVEALKSSGGDADYEALIGGLGKRSFLLYSNRRKDPTVFSTRWALSYLRGPMTLAEIGRVQPAAAQPTPTKPTPERPPKLTTAPAPEASSAAAPANPVTTTSSPERAPATPSRESLLKLPSSPPEIPAHVVRRSTDWLEEVGADPDGRRWAPMVLARLQLFVPEPQSRVLQEWELVFPRLDDEMRAEIGLTVDWDDKDLMGDHPRGGSVAVVGAQIDDLGWWERLRKMLVQWTDGKRVRQVHRNEDLELASRFDEGLELFSKRCQAEAERRADAEVSALWTAETRQIRQWRTQLQQTEYKLNEAMADAAAVIAASEELERSANLMNAAVRGFVSSADVAAAVERRHKAESRRDQVAQRRGQLQQALDEVLAKERALTDEVVELRRRWLVKAEAISSETLVQPAEVQVAHLGLLWVPTREEA